MALFGNKNPQVDEVARLKRAVEELSTLNELARSISMSQDSDAMIKTIVSRSVKAVVAEEVSITLIDPEELDLSGTIHYEVVKNSGDDHFHLNSHIKGCMCHEKRALLVNDPVNDPLFKRSKVPEGIRNFLCVPLMVKADIIGVLTAFNKVGGEFTTDDQRLLAIIGNQSAQVLDKKRTDEEAAAVAQLTHDMKLAELIQGGLLPKGPPQIPGFDVAGTSVPAGHVGGDYYDFIPLKDNRWAFALGDVSGKGVPAALLMANLQATLRSQVLQGTSCHACLTNCNKLLYLSTTHDRFATLFYARLDTRSNVLTYCNAGHERPFHVAASGETHRLTSGGLAVGILEEFEYEDDIVILQPGDMLVVFSDGVTDMINSRDEAFGEERLKELLHGSPDLSAQELVNLITSEVKKHAGGEPAFDDVTVVVLKKNA